MILISRLEKGFFIVVEEVMLKLKSFLEPKSAWKIVSKPENIGKNNKNN